MVDQEGVLTLDGQELRCYTRGGMFQLSTHSQAAQALGNTMNCMTWLNMATGTLLVGGDGGLAMFDLTTGGRLLKDIPLAGSVTTLHRSRAVWCGCIFICLSLFSKRKYQTIYVDS
jgi:hypothetical protein